MSRLRPVDDALDVERVRAAPDANVGPQAGDQEPKLIGPVAYSDPKHEADTVGSVPIHRRVYGRRAASLGARRGRVRPNRRGDPPSCLRRISSIACLISAGEYVRSPRARLSRASATSRRSSSVSGSPIGALSKASCTGSAGVVFALMPEQTKHRPASEASALNGHGRAAHRECS